MTADPGAFLACCHRGRAAAHSRKDQTVDRTILTPLRRTVAGICLVIAPVCFAVAEFLAPETQGSTKQMLDSMAGGRAAMPYAVITGLLASLLFIPGFFGLLTRPFPRGGRLADAGLAVTYYSLVALVALDGINVMFIAMIDPSMDRAAMVGLLDTLTQNPLALPILAGHYLLVLGLLLLALGLWRAGIGPRWAAASLGLAGVADAALSVAPLPEEVGSVVSNALLIAGSAAYGWFLLREPAQASSAEPSVVDLGERADLR